MSFEKNEVGAFRSDPRWMWEETKKLVIFSDDGLEIIRSCVIMRVKGFLEVFSIPLEVIDGNISHAEDLSLVKTILQKSLKNAEIDDYKFLTELNAVRANNRLPYAVILLIGEKKYKIYKKPNEREAIYGIGADDGLIILRSFHNAAVKHELAHVLGLPHHPDGAIVQCIMTYECNTTLFCKECRQKIEKWMMNQRIS